MGCFSAWHSWEHAHLTGTRTRCKKLTTSRCFTERYVSPSTQGSRQMGVAWAATRQPINKKRARRCDDLKCTHLNPKIFLVMLASLRIPLLLNAGDLLEKHSFVDLHPRVMGRPHHYPVGLQLISGTSVYLGFERNGATRYRKWVSKE